MDPAITKAYEAALKGQSFAFATITATSGAGTPRKAGTKLVVLADGTLAGTIGGGKYEQSVILACQKAIKSGKTDNLTYHLSGNKGQPICGGKFTVFIEPFAQQQHLIVCGGGHIALPLSVLARILNYQVTIIDNRRDFAHSGRFPHVQQVICGHYAKKIARLKAEPGASFVIITHGHEYDLECLLAALETPAGYIGVIGSFEKRRKFLAGLKVRGFVKKDLDRIHLPVGLDIGAQTPEEIAVSIIAEIISWRNVSALKTKKFLDKASTVRKVIKGRER